MQLAYYHPFKNNSSSNIATPSSSLDSVVMVANLKPAKLKGIESQGMLLAAGDGDVVKVLVVDDAVEEGADVH